MTLLVIADEESLVSELPEANADVLVSCGDLPEDVIMRAAQKCSCRHIVAVKGNHDGSADFPSPIQDLHLRSITVGNISFGGFAGAWKYKPAGHHLFEQNEVEQALREFPHVDVFVAHNSPRLVHDLEDDIHLGFTAFVGYIGRSRPRLFLHGHQHVHRESIIASTHVIGTYGHRFIVIPE